MFYVTGRYVVIETSTNFVLFDPIILNGVIAVSTDTGQIKIGNGTTRWSSLAYSGSSAIGSKLIVSRTPVNHEIPRYSNLSDKWEYSLHGYVDTITNWESNNDTFPTFCLMIEKDDLLDTPTGRIKVSDGKTPSYEIPWVWFNFSEFPSGYAPYYNGTTIAYERYQPYNVLPFVATPEGKFAKDDGTYAFPEITGPLTLLESDKVYVFETITLGGFPTEPESITFTTDGTNLLVDGQKVWTEYNDGTGSGLDADTLDGHHSAIFATEGDITIPRYYGELAIEPPTYKPGDYYYDTVSSAVKMYIASIGWLSFATV
jgi:hypothetical protein